MSVTNASALSLALPAHEPDKIIGIFTGSITIPAYTGLNPPYEEETFITGFGDTCLTRCVYQVDGGQKNDDNMGIEIAGIRNTVKGSSFSRNNLVGFAATNSDTLASHDLTYSIYCYAKSTQALVTPITTNQPLAYASKFNYEKIYLEDIRPVTTSTASNVSFTIFHDLNYIPDTKTSIEYTSANVVSGSFSYDLGSIWPASLSQTLDFTGSPIAHNGALCSVALTPTTATYTFAPDPNVELGLNVHYRIYLDD